MASATLVVMPSRWEEPFGLVAVEAALRGKAVLATAVGGLREAAAFDAADAVFDPTDEDETGRWHAVGCEHCGHTGYKGRTGVYELMVADDAVRALVHSRASEAELHAAATAAGLRSMREDGERLIREGITSPEEVVRVTRD